MTVSRQSGMGLIELMVGLVVGLLVVIAATGSLVTTRTASRVMGDSTRLQQDAATAFRVIGQTARQAGARRLVDLPGGAVSFNPQYQGIQVNPNTALPISIKGTDGARNGPDTLTIDRDHTLASNITAVATSFDSADCLGDSVTPGQSVSNTFLVDGGLLKCDGSGKTKGTYGLVAGVEDFQVWYGLRESDGLRYTTASALAQRSPAPWDQVEALRICLRLAGELNNQPSAPTKGCQDEAIPDDGRLRRVFFRVFTLRNADL
jgi:type IV pilus assembly protein PilW